MSRRFGLLSNPLSHSVSKRGSVLQTVQARDAGASFRELVDFTRLTDLLNDFADEGIEALFIEGGDGTAMAVLSEILAGRTFLRKDIPIGLLPGGNTNLAAKVIGVRKAGRGGIRRLLASLDTDEIAEHTHALPLLQIGLSANTAPLYGFFLSTGALPNAIRFCRREMHERGAAGSLAVGLTVGRLILGPRAADGNEVVRPTDMSFESQRFTAGGSHLFTLATTLPHLSLGLDPFWGEGDGPLRFTHATWPVKGLTRAFLSVILGTGALRRQRMRQRGFESFNLDDALMSYKGDLVLDGEFLTPPPSGKITLSTTAPVRFIR